MSVKSASKWATHGSICGCAWSVDTLAAVIRPRTSTRPSIFIVPNIRSYAPLSPARHGYGVTWTNFRLGRLRTSILRLVHLLPQNLVDKFIYPKFVAQNLLPQIDYASHNLDPYALDSYKKILTDLLHVFSFAVSCDGISRSAIGSAGVEPGPGPVAKANS